MGGGRNNYTKPQPHPHVGVAWCNYLRHFLEDSGGGGGLRCLGGELRCLGGELRCLGGELRCLGEVFGRGVEVFGRGVEVFRREASPHP